MLQGIVDKARLSAGTTILDQGRKWRREIVNPERACRIPASASHSARVVSSNARAHAARPRLRFPGVDAELLLNGS